MIFLYFLNKVEFSHSTLAYFILYREFFDFPSTKALVQVTVPNLTNERESRVILVQSAKVKISIFMMNPVYRSIEHKK